MVKEKDYIKEMEIARRNEMKFNSANNHLSNKHVSLYLAYFVFASLLLLTFSTFIFPNAFNKMDLTNAEITGNAIQSPSITGMSFKVSTTNEDMNKYITEQSSFPYYYINPPYTNVYTIQDESPPIVKIYFSSIKNIPNFGIQQTIYKEGQEVMLPTLKQVLSVMYNFNYLSPEGLSKLSTNPLLSLDLDKLKNSRISADTFKENGDVIVLYPLDNEKINRIVGNSYVYVYQGINEQPWDYDEDDFLHQFNNPENYAYLCVFKSVEELNSFDKSNKIYCPIISLDDFIKEQYGVNLIKARITENGGTNEQEDTKTKNQEINVNIETDVPTFDGITKSDEEKINEFMEKIASTKRDINPILIDGIAVDLTPRISGLTYSSSEGKEYYNFNIMAPEGSVVQIDTKTIIDWNNLLAEEEERLNEELKLEEDLIQQVTDNKKKEEYENNRNEIETAITEIQRTRNSQGGSDSNFIVSKIASNDLSPEKTQLLANGNLAILNTPEDNNNDEITPEVDISIFTTKRLEEITDLASSSSTSGRTTSGGTASSNEEPTSEIVALSFNIENQGTIELSAKEKIIINDDKNNQYELTSASLSDNKITIKFKADMTHFTNNPSEIYIYLNKGALKLNDKDIKTVKVTIKQDNVNKIKEAIAEKIKSQTQQTT